MGAPTIPPASDSEIDIARTGLMLQAEAHGLDMTDEKVLAFIEHEVKVKAQMFAENRWLQNIIHARDFG